MFIYPRVERDMLMKEVVAATCRLNCTASVGSEANPRNISKILWNQLEVYAHIDVLFLVCLPHQTAAPRAARA